MVNMGNVWDRTTEFLSDNLGAILPVALVALVLPAAVAQVLAGALPQIGVVPVYIAAVVVTLPALWGQLFVIRLALDPDAGRASALGGASRAFLPALLAMLLLFVLWIVLCAPVAIAFALSGVDITALQAGSSTAFATMSGGAALFIFLYGLVLAAFIIFVSVRLAMLYPVVATEGGVIGAVRRAFALSRGMFWRILGVMVLFGLVYWVASLAVGMVFGLLFKFIAPGAGPFGVGAIVVGLLQGLVQAAYTLLISAFTAKLYNAVTAARGRA